MMDYLALGFILIVVILNIVDYAGTRKEVTRREERYQAERSTDTHKNDEDMGRWRYLHESNSE